MTINDMPSELPREQVYRQLKTGFLRMLLGGAKRKLDAVRCSPPLQRRVELEIRAIEDELRSRRAI